MPRHGLRHMSNPRVAIRSVASVALQLSVAILLRGRAARPCALRGTAHWEGTRFVNDYAGTFNGKQTRWRDTFTFTPTSHTLVAAADTGDAKMKTLITTIATRK